jgi:hypothetical protein
VDIPSVVVSADISFRGAGVSKLVDSKVLTVTELGTPLPMNSFFAQVKAIPDIKQQIVNFVNMPPWGGDTSGVFLFELPPPNGWYSSALTLLDGWVVSEFICRPFWKVVCCSTRLITSFLEIKKGKSKGTAGVKFLRQFMVDDLSKLGCDISNLRVVGSDGKKRWSENIADSLIFLMCYGYNEGWGKEIFPSFDEHLNKKVLSKSGKIKITRKNYKFEEYKY